MLKTILIRIGTITLELSETFDYKIGGKQGYERKTKKHLVVIVLALSLVSFLILIAAVVAATVFLG